VMLSYSDDMPFQKSNWSALLAASSGHRI